MLLDTPKTNNLIVSPDYDIAKLGIFLTIFIFVILAILVLYKKIEFNKQQIVEFGLLSIMIATFFLPHMHERYLYVGDIISILYYFYNRDKIYVPIGVSLVSMYGYAVYLFGQRGIPIEIVSIMYLILLIIVAVDICKKYFGKDEDLKRLNEINN